MDIFYPFKLEAAVDHLSESRYGLFGVLLGHD